MKGATENALLALPFKAAFMFRPGFIQPLKGVRSRTKLYQAFYSVAAPMYPVLRRLTPNSVTTTVNLGKALIEVSIAGYPRRILETADIRSRRGGKSLSFKQPGFASSGAGPGVADLSTDDSPMIGPGGIEKTAQRLIHRFATQPERRVVNR